jgi:hypothetical protein
LLCAFISPAARITNLYTTAVVVGWKCVLFGSIVELVFRNGLGNVVAAVARFLPLIIAFVLAGGGDTIAVL